jgi:glutathione synthase/RimK-type ligase-like ATP-grasp enzyme
MKQPDIALVTAREARGLDEDQPPLENALTSAGAQVHVVDWDDPGADWSRFSLALLRSAWDYAPRLGEFLEWAQRASHLTKLLNPVQVVRWNTDKHYLADLAHKGVPIVPSEFIEPGEDGAARLAQFLDRHGEAEFVVKPAVGAGSRDAQRHHHEDRSAATAHVRRLLDARRSVLLQPYLHRVDEYGETALMYFDGSFSHAIRKGPLLRRGEGPTEGLFATETITPREPSAAELHVGSQAMAAMPFPTPLYARVDLILDSDGAPCVLELELTEPSLFFVHAPGSAERFAAAIMARIG